MVNWEDVQDLSEYGAPRVEDFIRHFWTSRYGDPKAKALYRLIRRRLEQDDIQSLAFSQQLAADAEVYEGLLAGRDVDSGFQSVLASLRTLRAHAAYPLLLSAKATLSPDGQVAVGRSALSLIVRHSIVGQREGTLLEAVLYSAAVALRTSADVVETRLTLESFAPNDAAFVSAFSTVSLGRIFQAAYVLRGLEEYLRPDDNEVQTPANVNVEHIYPKTPDAEAWEAWPEDSVDHVNRLGNLTLLAQRPNKAIRNGGFDLKKERAYAASALVLTRSLLAHTEWTPAAVEERQRELAVHAPRIWPLEVSTGRV